VTILDRIEGCGRHGLVWRWQYAPGLEVRQPDADRSVSGISSSGEVRFVMSWHGRELSGKIEPTRYHPNYGATVPIKCLAISVQADLPYEARFVLRSGDISGA